MKTGRNDPCPCGGGKKFKHCCFGRKAPPGNQPRPQTEATRRRRGRAIPTEAISHLEGDQESASGVAIRGLLVDFCGRFLTYEVTTRVFRLCDRLDLGTEFSLSRGRPEIWAAAIAIVIARVNALFGAPDPLGVAAADIYDFFGTNPETVRRKARQVRKALGIDTGHPDYCRTDAAAAPAPGPRRPGIGSRSRRDASGRGNARSAIADKQMRLFDD